MSDNPIDPILESDEDVIGKVLAQAPAAVTDVELDALIAHLRRDRALFIKADLNKGVKTDEPAQLPDSGE